MTGSEMRTFVAFDLETNGLHAKPGVAAVTQLAAVRFSIDDDDGDDAGSVTRARPERVFSSYVRLEPGFALDPEAVRVTGIKEDALRDAPSLTEVLDGLFAFADEARGGDALEGAHPDPVFVGHNVERFDVPFLAAAAEGAGVPAQLRDRIRGLRLVDTLRLARARIGAPLASFTLEDVHAHLGGPKFAAHDAARDAAAAGRILAALLRPGEDLGELARSMRAPLPPLRVPFGKKYRGARWEEIDDGYLDWILSRDFDADIMAAAGAERRRRRSGRAPSEAP